MNELVLFLHIFSAMAWVGAGLFIQLSSVRIKASSGTKAQARYLVGLEWTGNRFFLPASLLTLLTGIALVLSGSSFDFSDAWIVGALALFVVSAVVAGAVGGKRAKDMAAHLAANDLDSDRFNQLATRFSNLQWADVVIVIAILGLMVFKPGA